VDVLDQEVVGDQVVVRLRVRGGRLEQLADVLGGASSGEAEQRQRILQGQSPNLIGDQAGLARRNPDVAGAGVDDGALRGLLLCCRLA
jgi:hypothetical protein